MPFELHIKKHILWDIVSHEMQRRLWQVCIDADESGCLVMARKRVVT